MARLESGDVIISSGAAIGMDRVSAHNKWVVLDLKYCLQQGT